MTPTFVVLHIYKGATFRDVLEFKNPDATPIDLSARTARMQIRETVESATVLIELTTESGTIILNAQGELAFDLSDIATSALPSGFDAAQWVYDLEWVLPDGSVERPIQGVVVVWPETTR